MIGGWFLESGVFLQITKASQTSVSVQCQSDYEAEYFSRSDDGSSKILSVVGENAAINITGVLTKAPNWAAAFFGGGNTTYSEINNALAIADRDDSVTGITLSIDSGGGQISGLFDTLAAIEAVDKPVTAVVRDMAASAAYAIASQADSIVAQNEAAIVGSIGVRQDHFVDDDVITVVSSNAPNKHPDVSTEEGQAVIRGELDAMEKIFIDAIAKGRDVSSKKVIADFGQGGVFLAHDALKRGMIDSVASGSIKTAVTTTTTTTLRGCRGGIMEAKKMDLEEFKINHPALYVAVKTEGATEGTVKERDRVNAHLVMGQESGDMKTALAAVEDGSDMTLKLQAQYMAAGMNRKDTVARQKDDAVASVADNAMNSGVDSDEVVAERVLAQAAEKCGVNLKGLAHV